jgi:hypothetical protein
MSFGQPLGAARAVSEGGNPTWLSNTQMDWMYGLNSARGAKKVIFILFG